MYIIICVAGGCNDYAPQTAWIFRSQKDCTVFVGKTYMAAVKRLKERGMVIIDGKAFCLRYTETKKI